MSTDTANSLGDADYERDHMLVKRLDHRQKIALWWVVLLMCSLVLAVIPKEGTLAGDGVQEAAPVSSSISTKPVDIDEWPSRGGYFERVLPSGPSIQSVELDGTNGVSYAQDRSLGGNAEHQGTNGIVVSDNGSSTPAIRIYRIGDADTGEDESDLGGSVTWMKDEVPYYKQDYSQWCWAASLSMTHQWWSPKKLGTSYSQESEIVKYVKGGVVNQGATLNEMHDVMQHWHSIDSQYEDF
ncbi:MAG: hypothetical protein KAW84_03695, partial [Thermoplasmata archaeon]|nr:hypothetical protein [Thermoplasmata archaeon]